MSGLPLNSSSPVTEPRRFTRALLLPVILGCLLQSGLVAAEPDQAVRWLERVSQAARSLNYEGVFVYQHRGRLEAMRIFHRADGGGERERLFSLTGSAREIIRDNQKVACFLPDSRSVVVDQRQMANPLTQLVPKDVDSLSRSYELRVTGEGRVAGRPATRIGIIPRDQYRFGYGLWIDQETGLLLQAEVFGEQGALIEQLMFTELRILETIPESMLEPQLAGEDFNWFPETPLQAMEDARSGWTLGQLPPGFELVLHERRRLPGSEQPVEHLLLSDGLASVSVYVEKAGTVDGFNGHSQMGAVNAYGRLLDDGIQITAVGEVPAITVEAIGESVRPGD